MVTRNLFCLLALFNAGEKERETMVFCAGSGEVDFEEFYGIPTPLAPLFLGHFSPVLRRLFTVISRFPASWRQDGENGRKMA